jgi:LppX/LprAFG-like lipoprotein
MTSRTRLLTRTLAATLTLGVALTVAGCGNENTGPGYANSQSNSGGVTYADQELDKTDIMRVAYDAAKKAGTAHIAMTMTGKSSFSAKGDVAYGQAQPRMSMSMSMPQLGKGKIEMRYVGKVIYMQIPGVTPAGKYIAIDPSDKNSPLAKSFAGTTDQMDPLQSIKAMESAVQSAERVGKQTMGGATVEHYQLTVDTAALVKGLTPSAAKQADIPKTITYDLWLDEKHLLRRVSFDMSGTTFESTMTRWGKPVHVQRPSADQLVAMPGA